MNAPMRKEAPSVRPSLSLLLGQPVGDCKVARLLDLHFLVVLSLPKTLSKEDAMIEHCQWWLVAVLHPIFGSREGFVRNA